MANRVDPDEFPRRPRWSFPNPAEVGDQDVVGLGADLEPATLLQAYRSGIFPMPLGPDGPLAWWSPDPRAVFELADFVPNRSLRKSARRFEIRIDTSFAQVIAACADPVRPNGWIDDSIEQAYLRLFDLGFAHSVEAWRDDELAGGLYGVAIGGLFAGESMFHRQRDASKVALLGLVEVLRGACSTTAGCSDRLLDVQFLTAHLAQLGAVEIPRAQYLTRLRRALHASLPGELRRGSSLQPPSIPEETASMQPSDEEGTSR